jgi:hypothetical protein
MMTFPHTKGLVAPLGPLGAAPTSFQAADPPSDADQLLSLYLVRPPAPAPPAAPEDPTGGLLLFEEQAAVGATELPPRRGKSTLFSSLAKEIENG